VWFWDFEGKEDRVGFGGKAGSAGLGKRDGDLVGFYSFVRAGKFLAWSRFWKIVEGCSEKGLQSDGVWGWYRESWRVRSLLSSNNALI
jgi:hypothetical protein